MRSMYYKKNCIGLILFLLGCTSQAWAMEGVGVYFKVSLSGKIYKQFSFLVEEDIRPEEGFKRMGWSLTSTEINYKLNQRFSTGAGYTLMTHFKASEELRNRYYLYATASYPIRRLTFSIRERFQSSYKAHTGHPKNFLRSMLNLSYRIGDGQFSPFTYIEVFNDTLGKMRMEKLRFSAGSNYKLDKHNSFQLYYRYNSIYHIEDPVNYRHCIGVCYSYQF